MKLHYLHACAALLICLASTSYVLFGQTLDSHKTALENMITAGKPVAITSFVGSDIFSKIPKQAADFLKSLRVSNPKIGGPPKGFSKGYTYQGSVSIQGQEASFRAMAVEVTRGQNGFAVFVGTPQGWKLSDLFPAFKALDQFKLPTLQLVLSTFAYTDQELGDVSISQGLTVVSTLELSGPLEKLNSIINKAGALGGALVTPQDNIVLRGIVPIKFDATYFLATIPFSFGIDFTKIKGVPEGFSNIIQKITTKDINFTTSAPEFPITLSTGVEVTFADQPTPISFNGYYSLGAMSISLSGAMDGLIQVGPVALGNVGFGVEMDEVVMAAAAAAGIPLPITGIGLRGELYLGKGDPTKQTAICKEGIPTLADQGDQPLETSGVTICVAGALKLKAGTQDAPQIAVDSQEDTAAPVAGDQVSVENAPAEGISVGDFALVGIANNLQLSHWTEWLIRKFKRNVSLSHFPIVTLKRMIVYIVSSSTYIAGRLYRDGIVVDADTDVLGVDAGISFAIDPTNYLIQGEGHISQINTPVFKLMGTGTKRFYGPKKRQFDGAEATLLLSLTNPLKSGISVSGVVEIPPIGLKEKVVAELGPTGALIDLETVLKGNFNLQAVAQINLNLKEPEEFTGEFSLKQDFEDQLKKEIDAGIKQAQSKIQKRINKLKKEISDLKKSEKKKKKDCKKKTNIKNFFRKGFWEGVDKCFKSFGDKIDRGIKGLESKIDQSVKKDLNAIKKIGNVLTNVQVKSAKMTVLGQDLKQGKLPKVTVTIYVSTLRKTLTFSEQFDISDVQSMLKKLGGTIADSIWR